MGGIGLRSPNLLHSALLRQCVTFDGRIKWNTILEKCATLLYGLVKNHPFYDANKRTAFLSALYYLQQHNRTLCIPYKEFENFTVNIADNKLIGIQQVKKLIKNNGQDGEVIYISKFIKKSTRKTDKRDYTVTYRELDKILKRFDCYLDNAKGNYIDVIKIMKQRKGFFGKKTIQKHQRVTQIGFPSMTRQVDKREIAKIRKATRLTHEHGVDSQTFYKGLDTTAELIARYQAPLRRLARR